MKNDRKNKLEEKLKDLKNAKNDIFSVKKSQEENIEKAKTNINTLTQIESKYDFVIEMYEDSSQLDLGGINEYEYSSLMDPIESLAESGSVFSILNNSSKEISKEYNHIGNLCASTLSTAASGSSALVTIAQKRNAWFPQGNEIQKKYEVRDNISHFPHPYL